MLFHLEMVSKTEPSGDSSKQTLYVIKTRERDASRDGAFHKVHGQSLVEAPYYTLLSEMFSVNISQTPEIDKW